MPRIRHRDASIRSICFDPVRLPARPQKRGLGRVAVVIGRVMPVLRLVGWPDGRERYGTKPYHDLRCRGTERRQGMISRRSYNRPQGRPDGQPRLRVGIVARAGRWAVHIGHGRGRLTGCLTATQNQAGQNPDQPSVHDSSQLGTAWITAPVVIPNDMTWCQQRGTRVRLTRNAPATTICATAVG
jgi:hypothetical protein